jgi:radical SAM superfamily enzyme YgiQ (UPF0313 family)
LRAPDWLAYTTAVLMEAGRDAELYDFPARDWGKEHLRRLVREKQPALVVLDSTTPSIDSDLECAAICKQEAPSCKVIMVGPHASVQAAEVLEDGHGAVDAVARGEFEYTVRDYAGAILDGAALETVLGLTWLTDGLVLVNPDRPLIQDLDALPFPAWDQLDLWDYFDGTKQFPYIDIIGGRGCPYQCNFCLWPQVMHGHQYRFRSPANIVDEMEWVLKRWPKARRGEFFFEDDTFTVNKARAHAICDEIQRRRLHCTWSVNSRADVLDDELLRHMKAAGCRLVLVGFESGSQPMLDRMNKRIKVATMREFVAKVRGAGLSLHGCFVLGLPGETEATMRETIDFALGIDIDTVQFSGAVPFPGTRYFTDCQEHGLLRAKRWSEWLSEGEQSPVVDYPGLSAQKVEAAVNEGLHRFYFRPSYLSRFLFRTRSWSDFYRKCRGALHFFAYLRSGK